MKSINLDISSDESLDAAIETLERERERRKVKFKVGQWVQESPEHALEKIVEIDDDMVYTVDASGIGSEFRGVDWNVIREPGEIRQGDLYIYYPEWCDLEVGIWSEIVKPLSSNYKLIMPHEAYEHLIPGVEDE